MNSFTYCIPTKVIFGPGTETQAGKAVREAGGHHPQLLREVFAWHIRLQETGSMLEQI